MNKEKKDSQPLFAELIYTARTKEAAASVFNTGRYTAPIQALLEFTDNSVSHRDRTSIDPTYIHVAISQSKDRINVTDIGGQGADAAGIQSFFRMGETDNAGIGNRGAGAKFAAFYLGKDIEVLAKKPGDVADNAIKVPNLGDPTTPYKGKYPIDLSLTQIPRDKGCFEVTIEGLFEPARLPGEAALHRAFGEVYRPLLAQIEPKEKEQPPQARIIIDDNGNKQEVHDQVVLTISTKQKREIVKPLRIPLLPGYSEKNIKIIETENGEKIWLWTGEMNLQDKDSKFLEPGIRLYYQGRLLAIDYLGFNTKDLQLAGLTGEAHLDHIRDIKRQLSVNKSSGINSDSEQWKRVVKILHTTLEPLIEKMQNKPTAKIEKLPAFVDKSVQEAKRLMDFCLNNMEKDGSLTELADLMVGETQGQQLPTAKEKPREKAKKDKKGVAWKDQVPSTPPTIDMDTTIPRRRKSFFDRHEFRPLENSSIVSTLIDVPPKVGKKKQKVLILNSTNAVVKMSLLEGELATTRLVGEEIASHFSREYSSSLEGYQKCHQEIRSRFAQFLLSTPKYQQLEAQNKQSKESSGSKEKVIFQTR